MALLHSISCLWTSTLRLSVDGKIVRHILYLEGLVKADSTDLINLKWFVAQLKPNQNLIARKNLGRQGIEHFMPEVVREKVASKGPQIHQGALFPGYLFVAIDLAAPNWARVRNTRGVSHLISFGTGMPCAVPATFIGELMQRTGSDGQLLPETELQHGSLVRVKKGPFSDFIGKVQRLDEERRAWILLDFLGQQSRVGISIGNLELLRNGDL